MIRRVELEVLAGRQTLASLAALAEQVQRDHPGSSAREAGQAAATVAIARGLGEMVLTGELPASPSLSAVTADLARERDEAARVTPGRAGEAPAVSGRVTGLVIAAASGSIVGAVAAVLAGGCA